MAYGHSWISAPKSFNFSCKVLASLILKAFVPILHHYFEILHHDFGKILEKWCIFTWQCPLFYIPPKPLIYEGFWRYRQIYTIGIYSKMPKNGGFTK